MANSMAVIPDNEIIVEGGGGLVPSTQGASSGDVLTVGQNGPEWAAPGGGGGTTYTAGNMISLANDAIAVSTTAGITDIQQVAALPASPVSSVLYLIPET